MRKTSRAKSDALIDTTTANQLCDHILSLGNLPVSACKQLIHAVKMNTAATTGWSFNMISPQQNEAIIKWLRNNSTRPGVAVHLWAAILTTADPKTNEVSLSRQELADRVEVSPNAITDIIKELEGIGAVTRSRMPIPGIKGPGRLVIVVNNRVSTRLKGKARDDAQAKDQMINVQVMRGPKGRSAARLQHRANAA